MEELNFMKGTGIILCMGLIIPIPGAASPAGESGSPAEAKKILVEPVSKSIRDQFHLAGFYKKQVVLEGFPILGSEKVSDFALLEARYIIAQMLRGREDIIQGLIKRNIRCAVMAVNEFTTDIPEHSDLKPAGYWNRRARGLGPTRPRPCISCAEENLLQYPGDPYSTENILIHEFGHCIHEGLKAIDAGFDSRLRATFKKATEKGLWKGKYAGRNRDEYWAEGVQSYFGSNRENDHDHNHVNTRKELEEYDPDLYGLINEVFRGNPWQYVPPKKRKEKGHLKGLSFTGTPSFRWPASLKKVRIRGGGR